MPERASDPPATLRDAAEVLRVDAVAALDGLATYRTDSELAWAVYKSTTADVSAEFIRRQLRAVRPADPHLDAEDVRDALVAVSDRADGYLTTELPSFIIQRAVSIHETFLLGLVRAWLAARPRNLIQSETAADGPDDDGPAKREDRKAERRVISFDRVLSESRAAIVDAEIERVVRKLAYQPLGKQYDRLVRLTKTGGCRPAGDDFARLRELVAGRNASVHAGGIVGPAYLAAAGERKRAGLGERLPLQSRYVADSLALVRRVVSGVADAARLAAGDAPARG